VALPRRGCARCGYFGFVGGWRTGRSDLYQRQKKISGAGDCLNAQIASYDYFDLSADWNVREGIDLRAGVENIFDIEPPIVSLSACPTGPCNNNSWPGVYDVLGRTLFVAATIKY
jgi:outer membrane receptor protein involved in Fe transport